ncbi:MAG: RimJ/RimL family protein N-acetyltransferase [Halieaceae bacterium]|jgi:RimJ/RimL family protein N-acetyltransferase
MPTIPTIDTPRLILRAHRAEDHAGAVAVWQHPQVYRFITGSALSEQEVWLRLLRYSGLWDFLGYGYWAVEERVSGCYVGQMGFADFKRGLVGFDGHYPEAGWVLHPDCAGRGYATEGMQAACTWLDTQATQPRSFCIIGPDNNRSVRVAEKIGYRFVLDADFDEESVGVYFRDRENPAL